jgi:hypothetical protein
LADFQQAIKKYWIWILAGIYIIAVSIYVLANPDKLQWDFKTYYYAGLAYSRGTDPYLLQSLSAQAGQEIGFPFAYPPLTLPLFRLFSVWFEYSTAYILYFVLKLAALAALVRLWVREFLPSQYRDIFPLILIFGFSGAIYLDLVAGNISIFEQLGLWTAFWALRRKRVALFSGIVVVVACFKLTPILFLLLPLLLIDRKQWKEPAIAFSGWLALQIGSYVFQPQLYTNFLTLASKLDERMPHNPSTLALIRDAGRWLSEKGIQLPEWLLVAFFAVVVLLVIWLTWRRLKDSRDTWQYRLYLVCLAYAVIVPRFKNYSYILLLIPAYVILIQSLQQRIHLGVILLLLSASFPLPFGLSGPASSLIWGYYPMILTMLLWWLSIRLDADQIPKKSDQRLPKEM